MFNSVDIDPEVKIILLACVISIVVCSFFMMVILFWVWFDKRFKITREVRKFRREIDQHARKKEREARQALSDEKWLKEIWEIFK